MSDDVVHRAKAALEGIRPAPWQVVGYGNMWAGEPGEHPPLGKIYGTANAAFICAARSLVPELVAEVEKLRAALADVCIDQYIRDNGLAGIKPAASRFERGRLTMQVDRLGVGQDGERFKDNQGDVWEWDTNRWRCGRWSLYPSDDQDEFGPFTDITDRPTIGRHP